MPSWTRAMYLPSGLWSTWGGWCSCNRGPKCGCARLPEVYLGATPVTGINEVKVDGEIVPPEAYRVDDWHVLVRIDGDAWPCCQDLAAADTEPNTFSVDFNYGRPPPAAGKAAAVELAYQLYLSCADSGSCSLPQRVTDVTRQGVSMVLLDPFSFFENGRTGLYVVDAWLSAINPTGRRGRATISSPDIGPAVRRVGT